MTFIKCQTENKRRDSMLMDVTGIVLVPGNGGRDCPGNGEHNEIECCCDGCDYLMCCTGNPGERLCLDCQNRDCPRWWEGRYRTRINHGSHQFLNRWQQMSTGHLHLDGFESHTLPKRKPHRMVWFSFWWTI